MLKNLLLSAFRNIRKKPGFSFINILGLAVGMATCLTILLYIDHELSYDNFQKDDVYRLALKRIYPEREVDFAVIPHSISPEMVVDFPKVEDQTRIFRIPNVATFQYEGETLSEDKLVIADSTIFSVLSIELIEGDEKTALRDPNSIILSESSAIAFFGSTDVLGKLMQGQNGNTVEVTAVAKDYPKKSHFEFGAITPLHAIGFFNNPNWASFSAMGYIRLQKGTDPLEIEEMLPDFIKQHAEGEIQLRNGISYDEYVAAGNGYIYTLQPIEDIYLTSHLNGEMKPNGNINYVYIFSIAAAFILIIAAINFMNLATARSVERAKEVGIRKVMGSQKGQLVMQFLSESVMIALFSGIIALLLTILFQPVFIQISGREIVLSEFFTVPNTSIVVLAVLTIGILAGLYPAFFISSYSPVGILKGSLKTSGKGVALRNVLVVLQFSISIALISATLLVYNQMDFMLNKPLGFDQDRIVVIENGFAVNNDPQNFAWDRIETFKRELEKLPEVSAAGYTSAMPGDAMNGFIVRVPGDSEKESLVTRVVGADNDFVSAMNIEVVEGRGFSKEFNDSLSIIVNRSTVDQLALVDPLGKKLTHVGDTLQTQYTIVGVVDDFHFESLHNEVEPVVLLCIRNPNTFINKYVVKVSSSKIDGGLASIENTWNEFVPQAPLRYYFLDSSLEDFYKSEQASGRLFTIFTMLAVIVACVGLLGLSAFIIAQKTKEIGVRKVLGSSVSGIVLLLSKDIIKLILISTLIAVPAVYFWITGWLENFAYVAKINWLIFVLAGVGALLIAFLTTSLQSTKAARVNPVESLRDE